MIRSGNYERVKGSVDMPKRAIVFDLDGTLVDTAPDLHDTLNAVLGRCGRAGISLGEVRHMVGDGVRALLERGFAASGGAPPADQFEAASADFLLHYEANVSLHSRPFPAVIAMLQQLRQAGHAMAVCTNKPYRFSARLLADLAMADYFGAVLGGDSLAVRKPHREHLLGTLAAIGAGPENAVMVGDSANDVAAARNAGVPVILVSFGYTATPARDLGGDLLIDSFDELPAALARLEATR